MVTGIDARPFAFGEKGRYRRARLAFCFIQAVGRRVGVNTRNVPFHAVGVSGGLCDQISIKLDFFLKLSLRLKDSTQLFNFVARPVGRKFGLKIRAREFPAPGKLDIRRRQVVKGLIAKRQGSGVEFVFVDETVGTYRRGILDIDRFHNLAEKRYGGFIGRFIAKVEVRPGQFVPRVL